LVALFNTVNKISISINTYFNYEYFLSDGVGANLNTKYHDVNKIVSWSYPEEVKCFAIWLIGGFFALVVVGICCKS
jgi:hypothetical protein